MKILIDARFWGLENSGLGRYTMNLVDNLITLDNINNYTILLRKKYFNLLNFPSNWEKIQTDFKHYTVAEQIKLPKIISTQKSDIVHFPHFNIPIFYKGKFVITIHDLIMHKFRGTKTTTLPAPLYLLKRSAYLYAFSNAVRRAEKIIVPSDFVKQQLQKSYKLSEDKIKVIYEGVDQRPKLTTSRLSVLKKYNLHSQYFIYTGNAYPHKNLSRALEAIVELNKNSRQKILFAIVSSRNVFTKRLEKIINDLNAKEFVKLLGFVPDNELTLLYKESLGFVYPSLMEGFGLPGLEAMAAGTLLLGSDIPVFREIYKKNIVYFNPYDYTAIKKAMQSVLELDDKTREGVIENGRKFVKNYSWSKMAQQTLKVYETALSQ